MNQLQNVYKWLSGSIALIPGFAVILTDLGTPPNISKVLFGGIVEACGAFTFLMLVINKKKLSAWSDQKVSRTSIIMFVLFFVSLLLYILLFNIQVVYSSKYDQKLFFPFWYQGDLQYMIKEAGSKLGAITNYGPQAVLDAISTSQPYLEITSLIFTVLYAAIFVFLVIGFGIPGFRASKEDIPDMATAKE